MRSAVAALALLSGLSLFAAVELPSETQLISFCGPRVAGLHFDVSINGQPQSIHSQQAVKSMFEWLDVDNDGVLSRKEVERAPSALRVRQLAWNYLFAVPESAPWAELDNDPIDDRVTLTELTQYYRRHDVGSPYLVISECQDTTSINDAILQTLDHDKNGSLDQKEWQSAEQKLRRFDADDNEVIRADELVSRAAYPGPAGTLMMTPVRKDNNWPAMLNRFPILRLPHDRNDRAWISAYMNRRNANGSAIPLANSGLPVEIVKKLDTDLNGEISASELTVLRALPPELVLSFQFNKTRAAHWSGHQPGPGRECAWMSFGDTRLVAYANDGRTPGDFETALATALERFEDADVDKEHVLTEAELKKSTYSPLRDHGPWADRNRDDRLTKDEWAAYLQLRQKLVNAQVVVTVIDLKQSLFELLDSDGDGGLSVPELRAGWQRLESLGCVQGGRIVFTKIPRTIRWVASRGLPKSLLCSPLGEGPDWFRALDRNHDGVVSRREFLGTDEAFRKLDTNDDGLIDQKEASKAVNR